MRHVAIVYTVFLGVLVASPLRALEPDLPKPDAASVQPDGPNLPKAPLAPSSKPLRLVVADQVSSNTAVVQYTPANPDVLASFESPTILTLKLKAGHRTYLYLCTGGTYFWHQVTSPSPYRFTGAYRFRVTSPGLPATCPSPNQIAFGFGFDGQIDDSQPSTQAVTRTADPTVCTFLETRTFAGLIAALCGVTSDDALVAAEALVSGESTWDTTVRVRTRAVDYFELGNSFTQVFAD